jgi:hypothetical protein
MATSGANLLARDPAYRYAHAGYLLRDVIRCPSAAVSTAHQEDDMSIAELVYEQVKALPDPLAREVLDFIGYLRERGERREWRDLMNAQAGSLAPVWDNAEDKVWDDV